MIQQGTLIESDGSEPDMAACLAAARLSTSSVKSYKNKRSKIWQGEDTLVLTSMTQMHKFKAFGRPFPLGQLKFMFDAYCLFLISTRVVLIIKTIQIIKDQFYGNFFSIFAFPTSILHILTFLARLRFAQKDIHREGLVGANFPYLPATLWWP